VKLVKLGQNKWISVIFGWFKKLKLAVLGGTTTGENEPPQCPRGRLGFREKKKRTRGKFHLSVKLKMRNPQFALRDEKGDIVHDHRKKRLVKPM